MKASAPRVTVLMGVYNGSNFVGAAVDSILAQTFTDFELLVVDDASTDSSAAILSRYRDPRIRIIRNESNCGLTRSLNIGLAVVRGELLARHDADDVAYPRRLERQVVFLDSHPEIALVGTQVRNIGPRGEVLRVRTRKPVTSEGIEWDMMFAAPFVHSSVMCRTAVLRDELGGYDETFLTSQDVEAWSRLVVVARVANLDEQLLDFRSHPQSVSERKYSATNVRRVESVLLRNVERSTGVCAETAEWPYLWDCIVNHNVLPRNRRAADAPRILDVIYRRFVERHPSARRNPEIRRSRAWILAETACYLAEDMKMRAAATFARAALLDPVATSRTAPRFGARLLFGRRADAARKARRARIGAAESDHK